MRSHTSGQYALLIRYLSDVKVYWSYFQIRIVSQIKQRAPDLKDREETVNKEKERVAREEEERKRAREERERRAKEVRERASKQ